MYTFHEMSLASRISPKVNQLIPVSGSESSSMVTLALTESPLDPENWKSRLGLVAVKDDWKYWSPIVNASASA